MRASIKEREFHRRVAADCFNRAWDLLDKKNRSSEDDVLMLHLAHASRYHWEMVGTPTNRAVGDWQISRIYGELGQPGLALRFAKSCLKTCRDNGLTQIMHMADEAMSRAYAIAKDYRRARRYLDRARRRLDKLALDKEDRTVYMGQINQTKALIRE